MPVKAWWWHTLLALLDFNRTNKHCIHLSSTSLQQRQSISLALFLQYPHSRSSRPELLCKKKVASGLPAILLKKRLWHRCFPMNFAKILRTPFFTWHLQWLLVALAFIEISYSNAVRNTLAAETWICLVSFNSGECWSKRLHFHMYFPHTNHSLH